MNRACFPKEKHQNSQKGAKFMNFLFWPFLWFWFAGATPDLSSVAESSLRLLVGKCEWEGGKGVKQVPFGAPRGPFSGIWHYKSSECPFQMLSPLGDKEVSKRHRPKCSQTLYVVLPALLQKPVGEFFLIFRREIWKI